MELPTTTVDDIEEYEDIDILVRVESIHEGTGVTSIVLSDRMGNKTQLGLFDDSPDYNLTEGHWFLLKEASGNLHEGDKELRPNFGDMRTQRIEDPPADLIEDALDEPATSDTPEAQDGQGRLALDIETINSVDESVLDLDNPEHLELLCVALGYQPVPGGPVETEVLFRKGTTPRAELELIEAVCDWLEARDAETLLTYNGSFDLGHLKGRTKLAGNKAPDSDRDLLQRLESVFTALEHDDQKVSGHSLEDIADVPETHWDIYRHDLDPTSWRRSQQDLGHFDEERKLTDPVISGSDIPYFGKVLLATKDTGDGAQTRALKEMIRQYAVADVEPLFDL